MYMYTERAKYLVYLDEGKYWLRIRQLTSGILIDMEVYEFMWILHNGGEIKLNEKKNNAKILMFEQASGYLRTEKNYIDIFATTVNENRQKLSTVLRCTIDNTTTMTREELRAEAKIMRKYGLTY